MTVVLRGKEEFDNNGLGDVTLDVDLEAERLVVQTRVLDNNTNVVIDFLG